MIFPSLTLVTVIQVEDKIRLDASLSFISGGTSEVITDILIQPEASESFISVYSIDARKRYLDWAYTTDEMKTVTVKVITDLDVVGRTRAYTINVLSAETDSLFSGDSELITLEPDILEYLPRGNNSYLYAHRKSQDLIIAHLDEQRIWKKDGERITKEDIASITDNEIREQFKQWSTFQTLLLIFESIKVSGDDIFQDKKIAYTQMRNTARSRSALRLDLDGDSKIDETPYDNRVMRLVRR